jgi:thymidylate kinase
VIYDLRGTNGSGKSTIVFEMMKVFEFAEHPYPFGSTDKPDYFFNECRALNLIVIGKYRTQCGGCDGITSQDRITSACRHWALVEGRNVIIEGSIVASVFDRWNKLAIQANDDYTFCFLDTPVEVCIERVKSRRAEANNTDVFDPYKTLVPRFGQINRVWAKCLDAKRKCAVIEHQRAYASFMELYNATHRRAVD